MIGRLLRFLKRLLAGSPPEIRRDRLRRRRRRGRIVLQSLRFRKADKAFRKKRSGEELCDEQPYRFARFHRRGEGWYDFSRDGNEEVLRYRRLPVFHTPQQLADWLELSIGQVAWLTHHCLPNDRPETEAEAHYHYRWLKKRSGGYRLIEAPKRLLKTVQKQILEEILSRFPPHPAAHGFVPGRSILTNARPHVGQRVVIRFDLENFYAAVRFSRVVAVFRGAGYSREAALWLSRLTTSALPAGFPFPQNDPFALTPYAGRHLPQGAPTSPALANLSAYVLDVRLSGLSRSFGVHFTRYADDLTFSGGKSLVKALPVFLPLVTRIIRDEHFRVNTKKRKVLRNNQRQMVTGVVVNERMNVSRRDYDRLKATLHNCLRFGPASQNRDERPDFAAHLRGRIAHVTQLNPARGEKLQRLFDRIRW